jgi:hypothetical protein
MDVEGKAISFVRRDTDMQGCSHQQDELDLGVSEGRKYEVNQGGRQSGKRRGQGSEPRRTCTFKPQTLAMTSGRSVRRNWIGENIQTIKTQENMFLSVKGGTF